MSCSKAWARRPTIAIALFGVLGLSACARDPHPELTAQAQQLLPSEQFKIKVTSQPEQIALGIHREGLSTNQDAALAQFVSQWREDGGGTVTVRAPTDAADLAAARQMAERVMAAAVRLGVPREKLVLAGYVSAHAPGAPITMSYDRFEAVAPNCSGGWGNVLASGANIPYDHFGCAVTANIATQIANPRDLLAPAVMTPADDSRREVVLGKYRKGETTSTNKDDQASGKSSDSQ